MQRVFVGLYQASISSPYGVTRLDRDEYARSFLKRLEQELVAHNYPNIRLQLLWADSGCIRFKAAVLVVLDSVVGLAAGAFIMQQAAALEAFTELATRTQTHWNCHVRDKDWACTVLSSKMNLASRFHFTSDGDTLDTVIRDVWHVPEADRAMIANSMLKAYRELIDPQTRRLKAGVFIAMITPEMLKQGK